MYMYVHVCMCGGGGEERRGAEARRRLRAASTVSKECFLRTCTSAPNSTLPLSALLRLRASCAYVYMHTCVCVARSSWPFKNPPPKKKTRKNWGR